MRLGQDPEVRFCFAARCWEELVQETFVLQHVSAATVGVGLLLDCCRHLRVECCYGQVYRQRDAGFLAMLDEVRNPD